MRYRTTLTRRGLRASLGSSGELWRPPRSTCRECRGVRDVVQEPKGETMMTSSSSAVASSECYDQVDAEFIRERSEEHTSELQSLMRISYAVFCLQKKHTKKKT